MCTFCNAPETQYHINIACTIVLWLKCEDPCAGRLINSSKHIAINQPTPHNSRWTIPLLDYIGIEDHVWMDSEAREDIWNGMWTRQLLQQLLLNSQDSFVSPQDYKATLAWLQRITAILQHAQRALYRILRVELLSKDLKTRSKQVISLRRKRHITRTQTLFEAWRIPYLKPASPRRKLQPRHESTPPHPLPFFRTDRC